MLEKLWNASPASLARSISYRIRHALKLTQSPPRWRKLKGGPASDLEMMLSDAWADMETGRWDHSIYEALQGIGRLEGATIWDVGAHVGYHTLGFARLGGANGRVIAFEPNPFNRERLTLNVDRNKEITSRVTIESYALADETSEMSLEVSADVDGAMSSCTHLRQALTPLSREVYDQFKSIRVPVTTVDAIISARPETTPQLIKIDVEGAEHLVLMGARQCLAAVRPALLIEVHNITCMFDVMRILLAAQYQPRIIDHEENNTWRCFLLAVKATW